MNQQPPDVQPLLVDEVTTTASFERESHNLAIDIVLIIIIVVGVLVFFIQLVLWPCHVVSRWQIALYLLLIYNSLSSDWSFIVLTFKCLTDGGYIPRLPCPPVAGCAETCYKGWSILNSALGRPFGANGQGQNFGFRRFHADTPQSASLPPSPAAV
ncbi:hypothetical protein PsYK624_075280 [Phanerochaete sordida]|uniref:Uncharacterized protein n=1 Tax=Phanerochaete sordida TaxID=48140 RepID=A0A9P3LEC9_9APHY|nr:hypothetical protein PsYK624_075280 [Phanerochaete sordida]